VFELVQVPVQVLVSLGLFVGRYLLVRRILPLGLLCDRLLCLWAVALAVLLASPVTLVRVPPTCWLRESLSSTLVAVLLSSWSRWLTRLLFMLLSMLLSRRIVMLSFMLLSILLSRRIIRLLSELLFRLLSRQLPCCPIR
jgi:hypothetical protein